MIRAHLRPIAIAGLLTLGLAAPAAADPAAQSPAGGERAKVHAAFDRFAQDWIADLKQRGRNARQAGRDHTGPNGGYQLELRPTGKPSVPYVGILKYREQRVRCTGKDSCQHGAAQPISEIFRFEGGKWVY